MKEELNYFQETVMGFWSLNKDPILGKEIWRNANTDQPLNFIQEDIQVLLQCVS